MKSCDLTLSTPEENLACDEALLDLCEAGSLRGVLRFWEPSRYFVVVGYANRAATEVNQDFCRRHDIPILRRCSGGGAVLQGPGCLNYSLILPLSDFPQLAGIAETNNYVLGRHQSALQDLLHARVEKQGHTDLSIGGLKFCGNSQRRHKESLLFHGSFLLHADVGLMEKVLPLPSHQPGYRVNRSHTDFLLNLKIPSPLLKSALSKTWAATDTLQDLPMDEISRLSHERYRLDSWNYKF